MTAKTTPERYIEGVGRRKAAIARVRITPAAKASFSINGRERDTYFRIPEHADTAGAALSVLTGTPSFAVSARVSGGGVTAQAEAVRLGLARALIKHNAESRPSLKKAGFLTRDSRVVERKHFGLKKARRAPQWAKR